MKNKNRENMGGWVVAVFLMYSSLAEAFFSTPPKAVYGGWRLAASPAAVSTEEGPPTGGSEPPTGGRGDGPGDEGSGSRGKQDEKLGLFVGVKEHAQNVFGAMRKAPLDVLAILGIIITIIGIFAGLILHFDNKLDSLESKIESRFDKIDSKFFDKIDGRFDPLDTTGARFFAGFFGGVLLAGVVYVVVTELKSK